MLFKLNSMIESTPAEISLNSELYFFKGTKSIKFVNQKIYELGNFFIIGYNNGVVLITSPAAPSLMINIFSLVLS